MLVLQITVFCSVVSSLLIITLAITRVDFFCADWLWRLVYHGAIKFIEAAVSGYLVSPHLAGCLGILCTLG